MRSLEMPLLPLIWDQGEHSESVKKYLKRAFNLDFPISGEWGYTSETPVVFEYCQGDMPVDYIAWERAFVEKRIYSECIVFRTQVDRFSGIEWELKGQRLLSVKNRKVDELTFQIEMLFDKDFEELKTEWEENSGFFSDTDGYDLHMQRRADLTYNYTSVFYFDVTSVLR